MSWWELVGQQIAAQMGADALRRAAQGEDLSDVAREGPRFRASALPGMGGEGERVLEGRSGGRHELPGRRARDRLETPNGRYSGADLVEGFARDLASELGEVTPGQVAGALTVLARAGWVIEVDWRTG